MTPRKRRTRARKDATSPVLKQAKPERAIPKAQTIVAGREDAALPAAVRQTRPDSESEAASVLLNLAKGEGLLRVSLARVNEPDFGCRQLKPQRRMHHQTALPTRGERQRRQVGTVFSVVM